MRRSLNTYFNSDFKISSVYTLKWRAVDCSCPQDCHTDRVLVFDKCRKQLTIFANLAVLQHHFTDFVVLTVCLTKLIFDQKFLKPFSIESFNCFGLREIIREIILCLWCKLLLTLKPSGDRFIPTRKLKVIFPLEWYFVMRQHFRVGQAKEKIYLVAV